MSLSLPQILDEHSNPASEPGSAAKKSRALFTEVCNDDDDDGDDDDAVSNDANEDSGGNNAMR